MQVCLINPPSVCADRWSMTPSQCLGLRSLSSYVAQSGEHIVHFIDALMLGRRTVSPYATGWMWGLPIEEIVKRVPADTDLIGVSAPFSQLAPIVHELVARLKERFHSVPVVMGGVYPSTQPRLALTSEADYIVVGEGEVALRTLAAGGALSAISGIYTRQSLTAPSIPAAPVVENLDDSAVPYSPFHSWKTTFDCRPGIESDAPQPW